MAFCTPKDSSQRIMSTPARPEGQGMGRRQAKDPPLTMREENSQSWTKNVGVILLDLGERWTGNSSDTVRLFSPPW